MSFLLKSTGSPIFDYKALRLLMGIIALALPYAVIYISLEPLTSISASYYTEARNTFVGMLFIVGSFMWAYNGHTLLETIASKVASAAAVIVALFPTSCDGCPGDATSFIHFTAAGILFLILAFFCLVPFRQNTKKQPGPKGRRAVIYLVCGIVMIVSLVVGVVGTFTLSDETVRNLRLIYWVELIALNAFGIAWITAGKAIPGLVAKDEALFKFGRSA